MTGFVFENGTQTDASGFQSGDQLVFGKALPTELGVTYNAASGFTTATVTLTSGSQSLTFANDALAGGKFTFLAGGDATLFVGKSGDDAPAQPIESKGDSAIYGFGGADTFTVGGEGNHLVNGGLGDDKITSAGTGNLYLLGGEGNDTVTGGVGNDHIYGNAVGVVQGSKDGADSLSGGAGADYIQGNAGIDTLNGGDGSDRIFGGADGDSISGGAGNDSINGNVGKDTIDGGADDDFIRGGKDADSLTGGAGDDQLYGDLGDDTIIGGAGIDFLYGGDGKDTFVLTTGGALRDAANGTNLETIFDFTDGTDKIGLNGYQVTAFVTSSTNFASEADAYTFAQSAIGVQTKTAAALQVGSDTILYYNDNNAATINSAVRLVGVNVTAVDATDFVAIP